MPLFNLFLNKVYQYPKRIVAQFISLNPSLEENINNSLSYENLNKTVLKLENWLKNFKVHIQIV